MFTTGHHMPGCLPDGETFETDSWSEAKECLLGEVHRAANEHLEGLEAFSTQGEEWQSAEAAWNAGLGLLESYSTVGDELAFTAPDGYRYYLEIVQ